MKVVMTQDKEYANIVINKLKDNNGYCPCQLLKNEDTKCRCKLFKDQLNNNIEGPCHCGLWVAIR